LRVSDRGEGLCREAEMVGLDFRSVVDVRNEDCEATFRA